MKNKIIICTVSFCALFFIVCLILTQCMPVYDTKQWQTVTIENCGSFKIPNDWKGYEEDGVYYIVDQENHPVMIQTASYSGIDPDDCGVLDSNKFYSDYTNLQIVSGTVISNGAYYGKVIVQYNDEQREQYFIDIGYDEQVLLIVWDESVNKTMVRTIAKSFISA